MSINEIKQELAKKFANMSFDDFESFKHDLDIMYSHKHPKTMSVDKEGNVWVNIPNAIGIR